MNGKRKSVRRDEMITSEKIKASWKEEKEWYQNPVTLLWVRIGEGVSIGDDVRIGNYARIANGVSIGDDVRIGNYARIANDVSIGEGVSIASITHKYIGTLALGGSSVRIRIGCEIHSAAHWDNHGAELAERHKELAWWEATGKHMLDFLKVGANNIEREILRSKGKKNDNRTLQTWGISINRRV